MKLDKINFNIKIPKNILITTPIAQKILPTMQAIDIDYKKSSLAIKNSFIPVFKGQLIQKEISYNPSAHIYCADAGEDIDPIAIKKMKEKAEERANTFTIQYDNEPCFSLKYIKQTYKDKESLNDPYFYFKYQNDARLESEYIDRLEHFANKRLTDASYFSIENKERLNIALKSLEEQKAYLEIRPWDKKKQQELEVAQYFVDENRQKYDLAKEKANKYQSQIDYAQYKRPLAAKRYNLLKDLDDKREDRIFFEQKIKTNDKKIVLNKESIIIINKEIGNKEKRIELHQQELKDTDVKIYLKRKIEVLEKNVKDAKKQTMELQNQIVAINNDNETIKKEVLSIKEKAVDEAFQRVENFYKEFYPQNLND